MTSHAHSPFIGVAMVEGNNGNTYQWAATSPPLCATEREDGRKFKFISTYMYFTFICRVKCTLYTESDECCGTK